MIFNLDGFDFDSLKDLDLHAVSTYQTLKILRKGLLSEIPLFGIGLKTVFIVVCYITRRAKNIQTEWFMPVKVFLRKECHVYRLKRIIQSYTFYSLDINRDISNVLFQVEKSFVNPFDTSFSCDLDHLWILSPFFVAVLCNSFNIRVEW